MKRALSIAVAIALAASVGCSDGAAPGSTVAVRFGTIPAAGPVGPAAASGPTLSSTAALDLDYDGSNGRLTITELWMIVEELKLKPVETGDCDDDIVAVECPDFEQRWFFIPVPVDGSDVQVAVTDADGRYDEFEIEVDDAEVDGDDPDDLADAQLIQEMFETQILPEFPGWPRKASMVVIGTFAPRNSDGTLGDAVPFQTYFEAEVEVEKPLIPVFDSAVHTEVTVRLNLGAWFSRPDGTVWDLSAIQNELVEFEIEMEDGFEIEVEDG